MKEFLKQFVEQKKVLILGFGREGKSTFKRLQEVGSYAKLAISDRNPISVSDCDGVLCISGETYLDVLDDYDIVFKSPGIMLPKRGTEYSCSIISQTEVFLKCYSAQTVGITGTKGKSTTSSLLYHVLKHSGRDCILAGNIGIPVFDIVEDISEETIIVLEMSCHQLEYIETAPATAAFLNLYEDHLDYYGTFERYANAKKNIYRRQKAGDILFCNPEFQPEANECASQICCVNAEVLPERAAKETKLRGKHNRFNIAVVYKICKYLNLKDEEIISTLSSFAPLAHRLEYVGTVQGVEYFDDSISTTVESTISAIASVENAGTVLIGGMDRGIEYSGLIEFLQTCKLDEIIFMYASGKRIYDEIQALEIKNDFSPKCAYVPDLKAAVDYARKATKEGKACILSPAAASYGYFNNFEERGDAFRGFVFENE